MAFFQGLATRTFNTYLTVSFDIFPPQNMFQTISFKTNWVLGAGCWVLGAGCWVLGAGCWVLGAGCWVLGAGCWVLGAGCWVLGAGAGLWF